jgi:hypothetical protein
MKRIKTRGFIQRFGSSLTFVRTDFQSEQKGAISSAGLWLCWGQTRPALWILSVTMSILYCGVVAVRAQEPSYVTKTVQQSSDTAKTEQESSDIAKTAQNPIAHIISVPFENDFYPQTGINKENEYVLEIKPVVPIPLSREWNLITRTIIPVIQTPDLTAEIKGTSGLGDIQESLFFSPTKAGLGGIIWGAGPAISAPTATEHIYGTGKTSVGPTVVVLKSQGHWLFGSLVQNLWSVEAGPRERRRKPDAAAAFRELQLAAQMVSHFVAYHHRKLETGRRTVARPRGWRSRKNCAFRKSTCECLRTIFRKCGIPERDEQVVGKVPDAVSISEKVKESENSFEAAS